MGAKWLHAMDAEGRTPLDRAFNSGHRAIAEILLQQERRDELELKDRTGSALHRAANLGLSDAVRSLLHYGTNPCTVDGETESALHKAVRMGHAKVVEVLLEHCDVNAPSSLGMTPLHWASLTGDAEIAQMLVCRGADPHIAGSAVDGLSPKQIAEAMDYDVLLGLFDGSISFV